MSYISRLIRATAPANTGPSPTLKTLKSSFEPFEGNRGTLFSGDEMGNHPDPAALVAVVDDHEIATTAHDWAGVVGRG